MSWVFSSKTDEEHSFDIPSFEIRGLTPMGAFHRLVRKAIQREIITMEDVSVLKGKVRDLLWILFSQETRNLNSWKRCLQGPFPSKSDKNSWLFFISERAIIDAFAVSKSITLDEIIRVFDETQPLFRNKIPIVLMSTFVNLFTSEYVKKSAIDYAKLSKITSTLSQFDSVDSEMLKQTPKWIVGSPPFHNVNKNRKDLLDSFIVELDKLVAEGIIKDDAHYHEVKHLIDEWKKLRRK
jgi:hypothetical protein